MIFSLFEELATSKKTPFLFGDKNQVLTREDARTLVSTIASAIDTKLRLNKNAAVAILLPRDIYYLSSIFAVWQAGHHFIPLNVEWPREHLVSVISKAQPDLVITLNPIEILGVNELMLSDALCAPSPSREQLARWHQRQKEPGNAYIIFTSGSTGEQKGVVISKDAYRAYIDWTKEYFNEFKDNLALLITSELTFDITLGDLAFALAFHSEVHISPDPRNFIFHCKLLKDRGIDTFYSVPSTILRLFSWAENRTDLDLSRIKLVMSGGDTFHPDMIALIKRVAKNSAFYNVYGPTEVTINCCATRLDNIAVEVAKKGIVPIGQPFKHLNAKLLSENSDEFSESLGELIIAGVQCMERYINDDDKTNKAFIEIKGVRYYKTGDLVEVGQDGLMYIVGRIDKLVKVKGYRISPIAIDNVLLAHVDVAECRTVPVKVDESEVVLISLVVLKKPKESQMISELMELCRKKLPLYMVPKNIYCISGIPLGVSGKYDNNELSTLAYKLYVGRGVDDESRLQ